MLQRCAERIEMRVKHHYFITNRFGLLKFLDKYQISYKICKLVDSRDNTYAFDLYEDQEAYVKFRAQFPFIGSIKTIEYSKLDIENAEWLSVRNRTTSVQWEYNEKAFKQSCPYKRPFLNEVYYRHIEQIDILSITKPVKWGKKQFFSGPDSADEIIFCSERAKLILENRWKGLEFWPVKKYNSSEKITDLYQLFFTQSIPVESLHGGNLAKCNACGRKIIRITEGTHQLVVDRKYLQDRNNVYKTESVLTNQLIGCTTFSLNIVSNDFYMYCERNKMNQGMIYEPIRLV
jgi:hypothetical protein